jgi:chromosome segregation ATPase
MEPCSTVLVLGAAAGVLTAGSSAASTASQLRGTARQRDEFRQACEKIGQELADTKKKHEDEIQKKDAAISVLTIVSVLTFNDLRDAERQLEDEWAKHAATKTALDASEDEKAKTQAELSDTKKKLDNFETLLWVGAPSLIILLAIAFYFTRVRA